QLIKAQTLGGNSWQIILRVLLPQAMPRLLDAVRLSLGAAWLFLIAAEAIAATEGLGYRIFLVRRYMAMDIILPYVVWITLLAFFIDWILVRVSRAWFPWYHVTEQPDASARSWRVISPNSMVRPRFWRISTLRGRPASSSPSLVPPGPAKRPFSSRYRAPSA